MNSRRFLIAALYFLFTLSTKAQAQDHSDCIYGEISTEDFNNKSDKFCLGANAIILAEIGKVSFEENEVKNFDVTYTRYVRIQIVNKHGLQAGQFILNLDASKPERGIFGTLPKPGLLKLKGVTYNLENGKIRKDYLGLTSVFTVKEGKNREIKKFALPALKEGSIFDVEYTIRAPSWKTPIGWEFQSAYPCFWSEYDLTLPDALPYSMKYYGDSVFHIRSTELVTHISEGHSYHQELPMSHFRWVKINEPAITSEPFISSLKNYADRVSVQQKWFLKVLGTKLEFSSSTWDEFSYMYFLFTGMENFENEKFNWMKRDLEPVTAGLNSKNDIAKAVFRYVRDHFSYTNQQNYIVSQTLQETIGEKNGNVADINLLLTAMLRKVHIEADPAILSTVGNGYGNLKYPMVQDYNYMICVAKIDGKDVLLDASQPLNPYGKLRPECYNGGAVTLSTKHCRLVNLRPDSLCESNRSDVIITSDEKGNLTGSLSIHCGTERSHTIREEIKKTSTKEYFASFMLNSQAIKFSNGELEEQGNPDNPLTVHCDMDFESSDNGDIIYLNPVLLPQYKNNPFSSVERKYIVEMPYRIDNIYLFTMDIPKGYQVEEMPSSSLIRLNVDEGSFEYTIEKGADNIQLQVRTKLNKTVFSIEEYSGLREFIAAVIKKENEHIVLRKIK